MKFWYADTQYSENRVLPYLSITINYEIKWPLERERKCVR